MDALAASFARVLATGCQKRVTPGNLGIQERDQEVVWEEANKLSTTKGMEAKDSLMARPMPSEYRMGAGGLYRPEVKEDKLSDKTPREGGR